MPKNAFTNSVRPYGWREICTEGVRALEALHEYLEDRENDEPLDLATLTLGENMPMAALVQDEFETYTLFWTPKGWKR